MQFEFDVVGFVVLIFLVVFFVIRSEFVGKTNEKEIEKMKEKHQKDIEELKRNSTDKDSSVWLEIRTMNSTMLEIVKSLGRLEGKIDYGHEKK